MHSQSKVLQSFQRALSSYDKEAIVQKSCATKLADYLKESDTPPVLERVFEFGCGTGFLTHQILDQFKVGHYIVNDLIEECEPFITVPSIDHSNSEFVAGDIDQIELPSSCDLICSSSCIQWSTDQNKLLDRITFALKEQGSLAISSFSNGHFKELESAKKSSLSSEALNYWSNQDWQNYLHPSYDTQLIETHEVTLWFESVRELLLHLRLTGVNGNAGQSWNQQSLLEFEERYRREFELDGKVPLSYRPIYIIARKKN